MNKTLIALLTVTTLTAASFSASAALVIGGTRVIYDGSKKEASLSVRNPDTGTATNVAVQLETADGAQKLGNGKTSTVNVDTSKNAQWDLHTRGYSSAGGATPGSISSVITVNFAYN